VRTVVAAAPPDGLAANLQYGSRRLWGLARNPVEGVARVREQLAERRAGWRPEETYRPEAEWERRAHEELLAAPWPCPETVAFMSVWEAALESLRECGVEVGRGSYGGWDDADSGLARAAWCVVRHLGPRQVVETGVARGLTSRIVLEALEANGGSGQLWSVDLPPALSSGLRQQTGIAVPERLRRRWRYLRGSSRRRLPKLVRTLDGVDMFLHDSMHTTRNVLFELETVWPALREGGVVLVDDVNLNRGLDFFRRDRSDELAALIGTSDDGQRLLALLRKERGG
jgi:hypothetical protein